MNLHLLRLFSASSISGISRECAYSWYSGSRMSPQIMGVGTADHIAVLKIRMFPPDPVEIGKIMEFRAGKCASRRDESQIGYQAGGRLSTWAG